MAKGEFETGVWIVRVGLHKINLTIRQNTPRRPSKVNPTDMSIADSKEDRKEDRELRGQMDRQHGKNATDEVAAHRVSTV